MNASPQAWPCLGYEKRYELVKFLGNNFTGRCQHCKKKYPAGKSYSSQLRQHFRVSFFPHFSGNTANLLLPFSFICFRICATQRLLLSGFACFSVHKKHSAAFQELDSIKRKGESKGLWELPPKFPANTQPLVTFLNIEENRLRRQVMPQADLDRSVDFVIGSVQPFSVAVNEQIQNLLNCLQL